jgi:sugar/nucleoside kinase (ribokinase family)
MRLLAILAAICLLSPSALAQTRECKLIPEAGARLACYDKAAQPAASADKRAAAKPVTPAPARAPGAKPDPAKYVDTIGAEDARMNAQLKNICRGC